MIKKERLAIAPKGNLVKSYGYVEGAFHKQDEDVAERLKKSMDNTKEEFKCNDSENVLLDTVFEVLSEPRNASIRNLSDASDQYTSDKIKSAILQIMDK